MNEYQKEFVKIFDLSKAQLSNYSKYLATKGIKNPFTEENKNRYLEQLHNCDSDDKYIKIINQFLTSVHQGHLFLKTENSLKAENSPLYYPLLFRYDNGKYKVSLADNSNLEGEEVELINGISPDEYILNLPGFSYDDENQKPYKLEFRVPIEKDMPLQLKLVDTKETIYYNQNKDYTQEEQEIKKRVSSQIAGKLNSHGGHIKWQVIDGIIYLSVDSFSRSKLNIDKIILEQLLNYIDANNIENVIIDIRGNGGGSDEYFELLGQLGNKEYNYTEEFKYLGGSITAEEINKEHKKFNIDELIQRKKQIPVVTKKTNYQIIGNNKTVKNITLLTDSFNFSSADKFVKFAKQTGYAKVVGSPTSGDGMGITPLTVTTPILERNSYSINIPSSEVKNYKEFITEPDERIADTPVCHYLYGTKGDTLLYQVIENIKKGVDNMMSEEKLSELEKKVDEAIKSDKTEELKALSSDLASLVKMQEAELAAKEQMQREEENAMQMQNSNTMEKAKQKTLGVMKPKKNILKNTNGFAEGFLFTLLIGFMSGAVFTIAYILFNAGKYTLTM